MARSYLAPSPIKTIASANPNAEAVDLWTTRRVAHRVHSLNNNRPERNENCVTHVVGLNCYLCPRLLKEHHQLIGVADLAGAERRRCFGARAGASIGSASFKAPIRRSAASAARSPLSQAPSMGPHSVSWVASPARYMQPMGSVSILREACPPRAA